MTNRGNYIYLEKFVDYIFKHNISSTLLVFIKQFNSYDFIGIRILNFRVWLIIYLMFHLKIMK